jgi:hypothetical protein
MNTSGSDMGDVSANNGLDSSSRASSSCDFLNSDDEETRKELGKKV